MRLASCLLLAACSSTPDYAGVYQITQHQWEAEIMANGNLACDAPGSAVSDGDAYFSFVTDANHPNAVQFVRCNAPAACVVQMDYVWYEADDGGGTNAQANLITSEFDPPKCQLALTTYEVAPSGSALHLDMAAREHYQDTADQCGIDRARALTSQSNCIWVEHFEGTRVQ